MTPTATEIPEILDQLERAVFERRTNDGTKLMLSLLYALNANVGSDGMFTAPSEEVDRRATYTRIAAMISALTCSPDFVLDLGQITDLCGRKPMLEAIFELSGFKDPGHLLAYHGTKHGAGAIRLTGNQVFLLSLFFSLDTMPEDLMAGVLSLPPDQLLPLMLGWFTAPFVHSELGEQHRRALIDASQKIEQVMPHPQVLQAITTAWMFCSYADYDKKHQLKKSLNEVWRRVGVNSGVKPQSRGRRMVERPTILVAAERMSSGHAMHRSYAQCLRQLRSKFHLVCLVVHNYITPDTKELFDEVLIIEDGRTLPQMAGLIVKAAPDIIYFPSLGMSEWTQLIANFRFAPIQLMTLGHPAPAMMETIDYSLVQKGHGELAHEFGVKVVERTSWGQFEPHAAVKAGVAVDRVQTSSDCLHIAVNSSMMKLSPRFLALCERLESDAKRPIHFHFFASMRGVGFDRMRQILARRFKRVTLEPSRSYDEFLQHLAQCDLALAAFPFGNTNSTVDTCLLGIPTVAYVANEVLSIGDRDVMRIVGLPDWLVSNNDEDYFQTAMKLIHDDAARQAIVDQLKATDVKAKLFQPPRPEDETEFVDAFWWIYQNHEALQASSQHLIKVGEPIPA